MTPWKVPCLRLHNIIFYTKDMCCINLKFLICYQEFYVWIFFIPKACSVKREEVGICLPE